MFKFNDWINSVEWWFNSVESDSGSNGSESSKDETESESSQSNTLDYSDSETESNASSDISDIEWNSCMLQLENLMTETYDDMCNQMAPSWDGEMESTE